MLISTPPPPRHPMPAADLLGKKAEQWHVDRTYMWKSEPERRPYRCGRLYRSQVWKLRSPVGQATHLVTMQGMFCWSYGTDFDIISIETPNGTLGLRPLWVGVVPRYLAIYCSVTTEALPS